MKGMVQLDTYNNDWYQPLIGASKLKQGLWYAVNILFFINPLQPFSAVKVLLLKAFGANIGKGVVIKPAVNIKFPWKLAVGNYSWIGEHVWIDNLVTVTIGSSVCISQGAMLLTGNHDYTSAAFGLVVKPIVIEDGAWIAAKAVVCPGVICMTHAVLSVMSVATRNMEPYTIYQGNPAVAVKKRVVSS